MTMQTSEVLNLAADEIERRGWGRGAHSWSGCGKNICLEEALALALGYEGCNLPSSRGGIWPDELETLSASRAVRAHLAERLKANQPLYMFNDCYAESATEVIGVLRATAVIEASREREAAEVSA